MTSSVEQKSLNVNDVCEIIKTGSLNGLATLKWAGLELTFKEAQTPRKEIEQTTPNEENSQGPEKEVPMSPEVLQQMEQDIKAAELEQMLINNPAQFEELISAGDIEYENQDRGTESTLP